MSKGKLFVISGASGVGKGTVLKAVMDARKDLIFSVSATTRAPRPGEVEGFHYYFVTKERFEEMIAQGEFLEYDNHAKNYYGTPRGQAEEKLTRDRLTLAFVDQITVYVTYGGDTGHNTGAVCVSQTAFYVIGDVLFRRDARHL